MPKPRKKPIYPSNRRSTPESKVRNALDNKDPEAYAWALLDYAFIQVKRNPDSRNWHLLLKEMSAQVIKAASASQAIESTSVSNESTVDAMKKAFEEMGYGQTE